MPGLAGSIFLRKVSVHRWSVDRRRTYRGGERCAPSGRSANRDAGVGRMRIEKRNTIILEAAAVVTTAAVVVRTEQTVLSRRESFRCLFLRLADFFICVFSKFIRILNSCRRRFDIRVWRWGYCRIDGFGKTGKRVESAVKMCLSRPVALSRIGFYDKASRKNGCQNRFEDCSKKR